MSQPCAASASLASNVFWNFRKLSYASITRQQPAPFLTSARTSYQTSISLSRPNPAIRRCFRTYSPTYNSIPQSHAAEEASNPPAAKDEPSTTEDPITQSEQAHGNDSTQPPTGEKRVKPRRHRKDKPAEQRPTSTKPPIRSVASKDPDTPIAWKSPEAWRVQKEALKKKFQGGWAPRKKLSPDDLERVRHLHSQDPEKYSTPNLADEFKVSPEAVRRILKSKWRPNEEQAAKRRENWEKRSSKIWNQMSELGLRPQRKSLSPYSDAATLEKAEKKS
ncbi:Required for respiratory growth protein 9 mitochondrial [Arachnomyces sp. PD_36]|nr:Required for respiratory growth protein 9 mitochondrial [Arachnomyces sp. PD_36]